MTGASHSPASSSTNLFPPTGETIAAASILRGVQRLLRQENFASIAEMPLGNGRRADVFAIGPDGTLWIVEIKSSIADFRSDRKWPEYRDYCDRLWFAVAPEFPSDILPDDCGLIRADAYGGAMLREAPVHPVAPARRKALLLAFARAAALRLTALQDPDGQID